MRVCAGWSGAWLSAYAETIFWQGYAMLACLQSDLRASTSANCIYKKVSLTCNITHQIWLRGCAIGLIKSFTQSAICLKSFLYVKYRISYEYDKVCVFIKLTIRPLHHVHFCINCLETRIYTVFSSAYFAHISKLYTLIILPNQIKCIKNVYSFIYLFMYIHIGRRYIL